MLVPAAVVGAGCDDDRSSAAGTASVKEVCEAQGTDPGVASPVVLDQPGVRLADLSEPETREIVSFATELATRATAGAKALDAGKDADRRRGATQLEQEAARLSLIVEQDEATAATVQSLRLRALSVSLSSAFDEPACTTAFGFAAEEPAPPTEPVVALRECFDEAGLLDDPLRWTAGTRQLSEADCAEPHDLQTIARFEYPAGEAVTYPGDVAVATFLTEECGDRLNSILGAPFGASGVTTIGTFPDAAAWEGGERHMECHAVSAEAKQLDAPI